jgi:hypothetical protein
MFMFIVLCLVLFVSVLWVFKYCMKIGLTDITELNEEKSPDFVTSQSRSPQLNDPGCDNVLRGQGYRTPRGVVIDEYGAMVE